MLLSIHGLVFHDLDKQIFLELVDERVKPEACPLVLQSDLLGCLSFGFFFLLVIIRLLSVISLYFKLAEVSEQHKDLRTFLVAVRI